jgi:hypothetical protein
MIKLENWTIQEETGYKPITTFYTDFSMADKFGLDAIKDTYKRAFNEWKSNYKYITELCMVMNWKCWAWYRRDIKKSELYGNLYYELDDWCRNNLKGEELDYYYQTTD